ncbi:hypothetical protein [Mamestra configurata nucleopolyhedrovirus A]|uniref:Maco-A 120 n=2 Tax=Mamestra configurata nucleopolyhedrovirus TaxID=207830 RepID=Q8QLB4_NPVMC|nr:hypothetical protein McnAVgp120 [Mamestra configurata nucleopolyhedrovirus A]UVZ34955.1 hypothetical protein [Melanchra picta nucleopolyhedrovirus]AAM09228.1 unknown [Mamestra configurata nucleopolyhedrovirus A]AAQ11139.1 hypothetical protein [Mamestra configurata nucleopolyhedrovirus A]QGX02365.1 maco-A 120 [Mamestra configurata nucleopolyhedrovirus A]QNH90600.1 maco-A 120 [Mamestra configurata nucleopolyhedrovirus A]
MRSMSISSHSHLVIMQSTDNNDSTVTKLTDVLFKKIATILYEKINEMQLRELPEITRQNNLSMHAFNMWRGTFIHRTSVVAKEIRSLITNYKHDKKYKAWLLENYARNETEEFDKLVECAVNDVMPQVNFANDMTWRRVLRANIDKHVHQDSCNCN